MKLHAAFVAPKQSILAEYLSSYTSKKLLTNHSMQQTPITQEEAWKQYYEILGKRVSRAMTIYGDGFRHGSVDCAARGMLGATTGFLDAPVKSLL
jgi:hypothetical protein